MKHLPTTKPRIKMEIQTTMSIKSFLAALAITLSGSTINAQVQIGADITGEATGDRSGYSISMPDAFTIAIGSVYNDDAGTNAGHVRIYSWNGTSWTQKGVDIDGEAAGDASGYSVSMPDANTVAIGATQNDGGGGSSGHVRIYSWNGSTWIQKGNDIDGEDASESGTTVSMPDSNTIAIGAPLFGNGDGHVRVFKWNDTAWVQKGLDIAAGSNSFDFLGWSVNMPDSNTVAIGAVFGNYVRIFTWDGSAWIQKGVDIVGEATGDQFGWSVSMPDSNTIGIGAPTNSGNAPGAGHVRIYTWDGSSWNQKGVDIDGDTTQANLGWSLSMPDSNTVGIGAIGNYTLNNGLIYTWNGSSWIKRGAGIAGVFATDDAGFSVCMPDSNTFAISAPDNDNGFQNAGHVRIYSLATIGISENNSNDLLRLYPNPAGSFIIVEVGDDYQNEEYSIYDNSGRIIMTGKLHSGSSTIQLSTLPSGHYTLRLGKDILKSFKVIRE